MIDALKISGIGFLGVFIGVLVIIAAVIILRLVFPADKSKSPFKRKKNKKTNTDTQDLESEEKTIEVKEIGVDNSPQIPQQGDRRE